MSDEVLPSQLTVNASYKDIPWEQAVKCSPRLQREVWNLVYRGQPVKIRPLEQELMMSSCSGPFWITNSLTVFKGKTLVLCACSHVLDIPIQ